MAVIIGTAGWSIPRSNAAEFASEGSALERYASRFSGVEINSSFYRSHRQSTWERWRDSVPENFRFAVKMPKIISHQRRIRNCAAETAAFLAEVGVLDAALGVFLLQLPPSLNFEATVARRFFEMLSSLTDVPVACEPRHPSWFDSSCDKLLDELGIARVAADPACVPLRRFLADAENFNIGDCTDLPKPIDQAMARHGYPPMPVTCASQQTHPA